MKQVFCIEGLDRLGKSTLISNIIYTLGFYQVIHFGKPEKLKAYENSLMPGDGVPPVGGAALYHYQSTSFRNSMMIANSGARIIFDRFHLGEPVYAPLYRGYSGDYVFEQERATGLDLNPNVRLILLTENFDCSDHFVSDGQSFNDASRRREQELFLAAFEKSSIKDKRTICVTDTSLERRGCFRDPQAILQEALA